MKRILNLLFISVLLVLSSCSGGNREFYTWAPTPPMGWNSWDCFGPTVTEQEVKANADYMSAHLKEHGWEYIVVDIRWYVENDKSHGYNQKDAIMNIDEFGRFQPAVNRFPSSADGKGFKPLADYIHGKGLKFGIHIMRGIPKPAVEKNTKIKGSSATAKDIYSADSLCSWLGDMYTVNADKDGAQEYYNSLFELYASWGVDFIKIDDLSRPYHQDEISMIREAIHKCGRPIVLSTSPGETPIEKAEHISANANMWRIIDDFWDNWPQLNEHFDLFEKWIPFMGPGHWPDGDMLPLGKIGIRAERGDNRMSRLTPDEQQTMMSLFAIARSPLMFGGNLPDNDEATLDLLSNDEVLNILKNSTNNHQVLNKDGLRIWVADDSKSGDRYAAIFFAAEPLVIDESKAIYTSKLITRKSGEQSTEISVKLKDTGKLYLAVSDGGDGNAWDYADWIEPTVSGTSGSMKLTYTAWKKANSGWGEGQVKKRTEGGILSVDGKEYSEGIGTLANSVIEYDIPEGFDTFTAKAGLDKECMGHTEGGTVKFLVFLEDPQGPRPPHFLKISISPSQLGMEGKCRVRDLWAGQDLGEYSDEMPLFIMNHGVRLLKLTKN
jgi:alpha-galactosidase